MLRAFLTAIILACGAGTAQSATIAFSVTLQGTMTACFGTLSLRTGCLSHPVGSPAQVTMFGTFDVDDPTVDAVISLQGTRQTMGVLSNIPGFPGIFAERAPGDRLPSNYFTGQYQAPTGPGASGVFTLLTVQASAGRVGDNFDYEFLLPTSLFPGLFKGRISSDGNFLIDLPFSGPVQTRALSFVAPPGTQTPIPLPAGLLLLLTGLSGLGLLRRRATAI